MIWFWAITLFIIGTLGVLGFLKFRYNQIIRGNNFFNKAATVFVLVGEDDARLAAVAAGMGAAAKDREHMQSAVAERSPQRRSKCVMRCAGPTKIIPRRCAGDSDVFIRRYPQLFGREAGAAIAVGEHPDAGAEQMVEEMQGENDGEEGRKGIVEPAVPPPSPLNPPVFPNVTPHEIKIRTVVRNFDLRPIGFSYGRHLPGQACGR